MKKLLLLSVIVLFSVYAGNLFAMPVEVLSSNLSISGSIDGGGAFDIPPYSASYAQSGSAPLANSVTHGGFYDGSSAASAAGYSISGGTNHSWVYTPTGLFSVSAAAWGSGGVVNGGGSAQASADVQFQPLSPMDQLTISYQAPNGSAATEGGWYGGNIVLKDLTSGIQIFSQAVPFTGFFNDVVGSYLIDYTLQTNNVYELYLSAQASSNYDGVFMSIWTNDITPVPTPEPATMLLLGLGLIGLAGVKRKLRN